MSNKVKKYTFRELFSSNYQFVIPFFQRGYAWDVEQWKQLFNDIREEIINELSTNDLHTDFEHFFSSIVAMPKQSSMGDIGKFDILDGQQRITTVYIFLGAIRDILLNKIDDETAKNFALTLNQYLENTLSFGEQDDYKKLKVFSNKGDRYQTYKIIFKSEPNDSLVYFDKECQSNGSKILTFNKWLTQGHKDYNIVKFGTEELITWANVLLDCLKIVWIPLEPHGNNAQAIFESLNARGTPLEPFELLCNYIFRGLEECSDKEIQEHYHNYWIHTENSIGRKNFDSYIMHLYSIGETKNIGKGRKIYSYFKKKNPEISYEKSLSHLEKLKNMSAYYKLIINPIRTNGIDDKIIILLKNINSTDMASATPFLMQILYEHVQKNISLDDVLSILKEVLTIIVRIKIVGQSTVKVSEFFPNLYSILEKDSDKISALHKRANEYDFLIEDSLFKDKLIHKSLYANSNTGFVRMLLVEIDKSQHSFGQYPDYSTMNTIEHICPQSSRDKESWANYLGSDADEPELESIIHSLGNLLLLSKPANSHASNNPFDEKIKTFHDITFLNKDIKNRHISGIKWNIQAIKDRGETLADIALKIWSLNLNR